MTTIKNLKKYSLEDKKFKIDNLDNKSFSVSRKKFISDESNTDFDYIILVNGNRAMDVTKDGIHPYGQRDYVERIGNYFLKQKKNVIVEHILLDNDAPLALESIMLADHVDKLASKDNIKTINLIGHSKGGALLFNSPKYFRNESSFKKTTITTTASPFMGCLLATPTFFLPQVRDVVYSQLPEYLAKPTYDALVNYYTKISSGSHMDNDIALSSFSSENYDPNFIAGMFDLANINAMKKIRFYQNYVTEIDDKTILDSIKRRDFTSVGMCLMDEFFMNEITDGFVEKSSQESVKDHLDIKMNSLKSRTHYFLTHDDDLEFILSSIDEKIDEYNERKKAY